MNRQPSMDYRVIDFRNIVCAVLIGDWHRCDISKFRICATAIRAESIVSTNCDADTLLTTFIMEVWSNKHSKAQDRR